MAPHLHYVQIKDRNAVRITFNGTPINVHACAKQANDKYPTQNLVSLNAPSNITEIAVSGPTR